MRISEKLPQFNNKSLFIVSGRRLAHFYQAFNGEINKIESIQLEEPKYSDNEGFFVRMGKGQIFGRGAVLEDKKIETDKKFLKEVKEKTEDISRREKIEEIYLFASGYIEKNLPHLLSNDIKSKISNSFRGNFSKHHPLDLVKKINKKSEGKKTKFISEAAMKILRKKK